MTDRELMRRAAKAAGYWSNQFNAPDNLPRPGWDPLTNDGDALRLAVRCAQLFGFYRFLRAWLIAMAKENGDPADPCAATRRAIVRAAAAMAGE